MNAEQAIEEFAAMFAAWVDAPDDPEDRAGRLVELENAARYNAPFTEFTKAVDFDAVTSGRPHITGEAFAAIFDVDATGGSVELRRDLVFVRATELLAAWRVEFGQTV